MEKTKEVIGGLALNEDNYPSDIDLLKERRGNKEVKYLTLSNVKQRLATCKPTTT